MPLVSEGVVSVVEGVPELNGAINGAFGGHLIKRKVVEHGFGAAGVLPKTGRPQTQKTYLCVSPGTV